MNISSLTEGFTEPEQQIIIAKLYDLLTRQSKKYLMGDSTSIRIETADELLRSSIYTIFLALEENGKSKRLLISENFDKLLHEGQIVLKEKLKSTNKLWQQVCITAPTIPNTYLKDTLTGLKSFFKRYDILFFAHQIPCSIDYPLCIPVSEKLLGLSYIEQWLRRLYTENMYLKNFSSDAVNNLLYKVSADYLDEPINLCEQPLINAVGLAILEKPIYTLKITQNDCRQLEKIMFDSSDFIAPLNKGIKMCLSELNVPNGTKVYLKEIIKNTLPRLKAVKGTKNLEGIFII